MTPTVGRVVHFFPAESDHEARTNGRGSGPIAAVIVGVWSDDCVNLMVLPDGPAPLWRTSVQRVGVDHRTVPRWDWPPKV